MASESYLALLRDPRWQRKRLEIMNRDGWTCRKCGDFESTLNVHHLRYERGHAPWEYDSGDLLTLCESCHERISKLDKRLNSVGDWHALGPIQRLYGISIALRVSSDSHETERTVIAHPSFEALEAAGEALDGIARMKGFHAALPIVASLAREREPTLRILDLIESIASTLDPENWERAGLAAEQAENESRQP